MYPQAAGMMVGSPLLAETRALIARMSTPPSNLRARIYNQLVRDLKAAGLYTNTKIKGLYLLAAHDAQAARLNIIENASNLSVTGSPVFTTDRGYAGDGSTGGLTATGSISTTSHCSGIWVNSFGGSSGEIRPGGTNGFIDAAATQIEARWGDTLNTTKSGLSGVKHAVMACLVPSTDPLRFYSNGVLVNSVLTGTLGGFSSGVVTIGIGFTARQAAAHWGFNLTDAEIAALYAALNRYLTALGAA